MCCHYVSLLGETFLRRNVLALTTLVTAQRFDHEHESCSWSNLIGFGFWFSLHPCGTLAQRAASAAEPLSPRQMCSRLIASPPALCCLPTQCFCITHMRPSILCTCDWSCTLLNDIAAKQCRAPRTYCGFSYCSSYRPLPAERMCRCLSNSALRKGAESPQNGTAAMVKVRGR